MSTSLASIELRKENLNKYNYTLSLLREGYRVGLIAEREIARIHREFMDLMKEIILQYTLGESSSVRIETAESIQLSILFSLDSLVSMYLSPHDAIGLLKLQSVKEIYRQSQEWLTSLLLETKTFYETVKRNKLHLNLDVYDTSFERALPDFFVRYDPVFGAHQTMTSLDYPLAFDDQKLQGVHYIRNYLNTLDLENKFCSHFPEDKVIGILKNHAYQYGINYEESLINVFEVVFNNCLFSALAGVNDYTWVMTELECNSLQRKLIQFSPKEVESLITWATRDIINDLNIGDPTLSKYIYRYKAKIQKLITGALQDNRLSILITTDQLGKEDAAKIILNCENRMDDEIFRSIIKKISQSGDLEERIKIIKGKFHSLLDIVDLLEADCLYGLEYFQLYESLGDLELAALIKLEFLRQEPLKREWQLVLDDFLQKEDSVRTERIKKYAHLIDFPDE